MFGSIAQAFRRTMVAGILVLLPATVTIILVNFVFQKADQTLAPMITRMLIMAGAELPPGYRIPGVGFVSLLIIVLVTGAFTRLYIGRKALQVTEFIMSKVPFVGTVYGSVRQLIDAFGTSSTKAFSQVVCVEYPHKEIYSLGFLTASVTPSVKKSIREQRDMVVIFIPTTPNPTSGLLILVPRENVMPLDISVEEGIKLIVSAGVVPPRSEAVAGVQVPPDLRPDPVVTREAPTVSWPVAENPGEDTDKEAGR